jgi:hypothetical protein
VAHYACDRETGTSDANPGATNTLRDGKMAVRRAAARDSHPGKTGSQRAVHRDLAGGCASDYRRRFFRPRHRGDPNSGKDD